MNIESVRPVRLRVHGYRTMVVALCGVSLAACAYQAPVTAAPNLNVYSSYGDRLPGSYALYVTSDNFSEVVKPTGYQCSFHNFPIDERAAFKDSVVKTMQQLVENVQVVDHPVSRDQLAKAGLRGQIVVEADSMNAHVQFIPGFWESSSTSNVELSANMNVDTVAGRMLGTTGEGAGNAEGSGGVMCGGGAEVIAEASGKAMKQLLGQLGERLSNSPRLRAENSVDNAQMAEKTVPATLSSTAQPAAKCRSGGVTTPTDPGAVRAIC